MTIIEQIKAEIERQIKDPQEHCYGVSSVNKLRELLSFLDTLESETTYDTQQYTPRPSVGIEDVARVQFASHAKVFDKKRKAVFDWEQFKDIASVFYGFGKKDTSNTLESEKPMDQKGLEREIERCLWQLSDDPSNEELCMFARHFYELGCRRTAEKYDEIEYNRQRAEESVCDELEKEIEKFLNKTGAHYVWCNDDEQKEWCSIIARHFAQWGAEHLANSNDEVVINGHKVEYDKDKDAITMEEIPNDLEEAAKKYAHCPFTDDDGNFHEDAFDANAYHDFIVGANWQKQHDAELIEIAYNDGITIGMTKQTEQMMKEAVEGEITKDNRGNNVVRAGVFNKDFEYGDKVRIIIVKEE